MDDPINDVSEEMKIKLIVETYWSAIRYLKEKLDGDSLIVFGEMLCIKTIQGRFPEHTERGLDMAWQSRNRIERLIKE